MPEQHPDILLIVLDTLRRDRLSTYGHHRETSPALDAFAADATLFERAVAPAQWTIPAHASLFTGHYPSTHQVVQGYGRLAEHYPTLAEILRDGGYHTIAFCNNPLVGVLNNGLRRGFDKFYNYSGTAPHRPVDEQRSHIRRILAQQWRQFARNVENQFAHSDTMFRISMHPFLVPIWTRFTNFKGHTQRSVDDLIDYWAMYHAGDAEEPLFTFVNLMGAHLPYKPQQDTINRLAPELRDDKRAYNFIRRFNSDAARWASPLERPFEAWERAALDGFYDAEIAQQDYHLGRLLQALKKSGRMDNTLIIIVADHGEGHGDHNYFGHSFVVYQELVHVPLLIRFPEQFPVGKRVTTNISTRRIFHTILDVAEVPAPFNPNDPNGDVQSLSLQMAVNGNLDSEKDIAFSEAYPPETFLHVIAHRQPHLIEPLRLRQIRRGIYDGEHKLVTVGQDVEALFDLSNDPTEVNNIADAHPIRVMTMRHKIDQFAHHVERYRTDSEHLDEVSEEVIDQLRALGYIE
ncbi:MAG: DUF229 domain-containing protein [Chloroflexi bacterium]|nr:MAG: DUF229 domain-containing protein [Chloroflexota bacterium]